MANYDLTYEGSRVQNILDTGDELRDAGYIFRGEATPSTVPGTPTERVAYIGGPGTYTNFGSSITVDAGCVCIFKYTGSAWSNQVINTGLSDAISSAINSEATTRSEADTALQNAINAINNNIGNGYVYAGVATPSTSPVTGKVFYLAVQAGTYTNFGNAVVTAGLNVLKKNGSAWSVDQVIAIDAEPTQGSANLVKSGGVLNSIIQNGPAFDLSAYNAQGGVLATYADLSAALTALNALPADFKKGGMSMKFVQTSDNKYVQYRLMGTSFSTNEENWQGVDDEPTSGSNNLVKSGGVNDRINKTIDISPAYFNFSTNYAINSYSGTFDASLKKGIKYIFKLESLTSTSQLTYLKFFGLVSITNVGETVEYIPSSDLNNISYTIVLSAGAPFKFTISVIGNAIAHFTEEVDTIKVDLKNKANKEQINRLCKVPLSNIFDITSPSELPIFNSIAAVSVDDNNWSPSENLYMKKIWHNNSGKIVIQIGNNQSVLATIESGSLTNNSGIYEWHLGSNYPFVFYIDCDILNNIALDLTDLGNNYLFSLSKIKQGIVYNMIYLNKLSFGYNFGDTNITDYFEYPIIQEYPNPMFKCIKAIELYDDSYVIPQNLYLFRIWKTDSKYLAIQFSTDGISTAKQIICNTDISVLEGLQIIKTNDSDYPFEFIIDSDLFNTITVYPHSMGTSYKFSNKKLHNTLIFYIDYLIKQREKEKTTNIQLNQLEFDVKSGTVFNNPFTKTPIIIFRTDDGNSVSDTSLTNVLDTYNIKCMYGLIAEEIRSNGNNYVEIYKNFVRNGHSILSHADNGTFFSELTEAEALQNIQAAQATFKQYGIEPLGFIYPGGVERYVDMLKKVYNYAVRGTFSGESDININSNSFNIYCASYDYVYDTAENTLAVLKSKVDAIITQGTGILCFGGHSYLINQSGHNTMETIEALCSYIKEKMDAFNVRSISPDSAVRELRQY